MDPVITARHCDIAPELRDRAVTILQRLGRLAGRPTDAAAVFSVGAGLAGAELRLDAPGDPVLVARADAADHRTALDLAEKRLRRQVARVSGRTRDARHSTELPQV
jgi:ribosome-associated translation inhibitor RaiA